jgi:hypothetical protein
MNVAYELWETRSGNLMDTFDSEDEALSVLAQAIRRHGDWATQIRSFSCVAKANVPTRSHLARN